jgi:uroporphyrinogen-III decarboxylase
MVFCDASTIPQSGNMSGVPHCGRHCRTGYLNQLADRVHELDSPIIIHICGDVKRVRHLLAQLRCDALCTDAMVSLPELKPDSPHVTTMGNLAPLPYSGRLQRASARWPGNWWHKGSISSLRPAV